MEQSRCERGQTPIGRRKRRDGRVPAWGRATIYSLCLTFALTMTNAHSASAQLCAYFAYMPNTSDGTVSVIDTSDNTVVATIPVGTSPIGVAAHPDGTFVYVTNEADDTVSVIDTATLTVVTTIPVGEFPNGVAFHPTGTFAYVANWGDDENLSVILTSNHSVYGSVPIPGSPHAVTVSPNGQHVYVTNVGNNTVAVVDPQSLSVVDTIAVGEFPDSIAMDPQGDLVYVGNHLDNTVSVIQRPEHNVIETIPVGNHPHDVAVHPQSTFIYVANDLDHTVSVIERDTWVQKATVPVTNSQALTVHPEGDRVYVSSATTASVVVFDTATNTISDVIPVGNLPWGLGEFIVCDPDIDNDGCNNDVDQHPDSSLARSGSLIPGPGCPSTVAQDKFAYEGAPVDTDGDGVFNCADFDDDNDGKCDDDETLPPGAPGVFGEGCVGPDPCPLNDNNISPLCSEIVICPENPPWWVDCRWLGSGCFEFFVKIDSLINPDPTARFDTIEIIDQTLYANVGANMFVEDAAKLLLGGSSRAPAGAVLATSEASAVTASVDEPSEAKRAKAGGAQTRGAGIRNDHVRLELWKKADPRGGPERFVALIAEYRTKDVEIGTLDGGRVLAIEPIHCDPTSPTGAKGPEGRCSLWVNAVRTPGAAPVCELKPASRRPPVKPAGLARKKLPRPSACMADRAR
jgi:YVTN family beta-propeller protein